MADKIYNKNRREARLMEEAYDRVYNEGALGGAAAGGLAGGAAGMLGGPLAPVTAPLGAAAGSLAGGLGGAVAGDEENMPVGNIAAQVSGPVSIAPDGTVIVDFAFANGEEYSATLTIHPEDLQEIIEIT